MPDRPDRPGDNTPKPPERVATDTADSLYTGLGEQEAAIDRLEQAFEQRSGGIYDVKGSYLLSSLRGHPRFQALLRNMNL